MTRKICIVTGTRAEYGLLRWLMEIIKGDDELELQLVVTGMHLSPEFGLTWRAIEEDGFVIDAKVEMLLSSDTAVGVTKSIGLGLIGFAEAFQRLQPDVLVLLGDRFEILAAATAAMVAKVPIAHLHGGEATEGLIDEAIRHSVSKMSHFHFVAAERYRRRVIQLGEQPDRVYTVGGLALDSLKHLQLLSRSDLESALGFRFLQRNLLITFHPVTLEGNAVDKLSGLLDALESLDETGFIFTLPNADPEGRELIKAITEFVDKHPHAVAFSSLGQLRYLSCMKVVDAVVGNSSSGLLEAPSLHTGTINIGSRQDGRLKAASVIDCQPSCQDILRALKYLYSDKFQAIVRNVQSPYGVSGASKKIAKLLKTAPLNGALKKQFYDLSDVCE